MAKPTPKKQFKKNQAPSAKIPVKSQGPGLRYSYLVIFIFAFILYGNTIKNEYAYDDTTVIQMNQLTQQGFKGIPTLFTKSYWFGMTGVNESYYRPLSLITFAVEIQFVGSNPHFSHFINTLLYALIGIILFSALLKIFKTTQLKFPDAYAFSIVSALLFLAHPVHTEVVANIKSRDEILGFLFSTLALHEMLRYDAEKKFYQLILSLFCFWLALLSKESTLVFIGIIPMVFYFFRNKSLKQCIQLCAPLLIVFLIYLGMRALFLDKMITGKEASNVIDNALVSAGNAADKYATVILILGFYIKLLFIPHPLIYTYSYNQIPIVSWTNPWAIASLILCLGLLIYAGFILLQKKTWTGTRVIIAFSILFFFASIFLVSNLVLPIAVTMAERLLFTPSLGFCLFFAWLIIRLSKLESGKDIFKNRKFSIVFTVILLLYSVKTISRNMDWKNNETLFTNDLIHVNNSAAAHRSYGIIVFDQAKAETDSQRKNVLINTALNEMKQSITIYDHYADAYSSLGDIYSFIKKYDEAIFNYKKSITYNNQYPPSYSNLGLVYDNLGQLDSAIWNYQQAIKINYRYAEAHLNLGLSLGKKGNLDGAIDEFLTAIRLKSGLVSAYSNLGTAYAMKGAQDEAIRYYSQAIQLNPKDALSCMNLSRVYDSKGDAMHAQQYREMAFQLDPGMQKLK